MSFTDIRRTNWMEKLPAAVHPYIYLMRLDRPIGWWLLLIPGWWAIALASIEPSARTVLMLFLFWIGAIVMRGAGCIINDLWDRDIDGQVERTRLRPIAAGQIKIEDAIIFLILLLGIGLSVLILMPPLTIFLGILTIPLIVIYPFMKRITWWPQAFLGITFNFGALMGWTAMTGELSWAAFFLYISGIFWTLGYDTIYAHQDKEDDLAVGIKSTAIRFGDQAYQWVIGFYDAALLFFLFALISAGAEWYTYILCTFAFVFTARKIYLWKPEDKQSSLDTFKSNKETGLFLFAALCIDMLF